MRSCRDPKGKHLDTVKKILMPYSFGKFCKALGILTASALAGSQLQPYILNWSTRSSLRPMSVDSYS